MVHSESGKRAVAKRSVRDQVTLNKKVIGFVKLWFRVQTERKYCKKTYIAELNSPDRTKSQ